MGALKPWHLTVVLCMLTSVALVTGIVVFAVKQAGRKR